MQILKGTKRDITIMEWDEQISKAKKKLADSQKCFEIYGDAASKMWIEEDEKKVAKLEKHKNEAITYMNLHGII